MDIDDIKPTISDPAQASISVLIQNYGMLEAILVAQAKIIAKLEDREYKEVLKSLLIQAEKSAADIQERLLQLYG